MHLDTVDMMVEGVPFEWLKKENQKNVCSKLLHDEQQSMYDLLPNQQQTNIAASNVRLLLEILSNAKKLKFLEK